MDRERPRERSITAHLQARALRLARVRSRTRERGPRDGPSSEPLGLYPLPRPLRIGGASSSACSTPANEQDTTLREGLDRLDYPHPTRSTPSKRTGHVENGLGNGTLAVTIEQWAVETVREQLLGKDDAARTHGSRPIEQLSQPQDRLSTRPHSRWLDPDGRDEPTSPDPIGILDNPTKVASEPLPSPGVRELPRTKRQPRARVI